MIKNPIKTAPKDGTWVLLWGGRTTERQYPTPLLTEEDETRPVIGRWMSRDADFGDEGFWEYSFTDGYWRLEYQDPKFWSPLAP